MVLNRLILALVFTVAATVLAYSHEWYDYDCCDTRDCYPLPGDAIIQENSAAGNWYAEWISPKTGKHIKGFVAPNNVRDTQNHQIHGCETLYGTPRCLYVHRGV